MKKHTSEEFNAKELLGASIFDALIDTTSKLYKYIRSLEFNEQDSEEITQETLVIYLKMITKKAPNKQYSMQSYLRVIAKRVISNKRLRKESMENSDIEVDSTISPADLEAEVENNVVLEKQLSKLGNIESKIMALTFSGFSPKEIASQLQLSKNRVYLARNKATKKLQKKLAVNQ